MEDAIAELTVKVGNELHKQHLVLATAESCTGGGLSYWITSQAGSSAWFDRGFVTYSNAAKMDLLGVDPDVLKTFGAVSEEAAREMALGALDNSQANMSIAITGIAGPDGGSPEKPIGTVWIALAVRDGDIKISRLQFEGDRIRVRKQSIEAALQMIIDWLMIK